MKESEIKDLVTIMNKKYISKEDDLNAAWAEFKENWFKNYKKEEEKE